MLRRVLLACAVAAGCAAISARAEPGDELERLRSESERMHRALDAFDARIRALETQIRDPRGGGPGHADAPVPPAAAAAMPSDAYALPLLRRNWSQVERGLPADRVEALLGKPENLLRIDGNLVWYYLYPGLGRGSVFFDGAGKVSSAQPPSGGRSW